jgi:hypothetical protein
VTRTRSAQVTGSAHVALVLALPFATLGCAMGRDQRPRDAGADDLDASTQVDAAEQPSPDAAIVPADAPGCAIAAGMTPVLDGSDDLSEYPIAQQLELGAMLGADAAAVAWDREQLFVTVTSSAFASPYEPLHLYVEAGTALAAAAAGTGKEYSSLVPALPFSPTHVVAVRRVSDAGTGAYDGVYVPGDGWSTRTLALDSSTVVSADQHTISVTVPWTALGGCPTALRLAWHVVHGAAGNEWKDLVPATHTPWQAPGGSYYEIDLTGALDVSAWSLH